MEKDKYIDDMVREMAKELEKEIDEEIIESIEDLLDADLGGKMDWGAIDEQRAEQERYSPSMFEEITKLRKK